MMKTSIRNTTRSTSARQFGLAMLGAVSLALAGCNSERDADDGQLINSVTLPTDVVLNLFCEDVGVFPETCVLDDPENPFAFTTIIEFDENNPDASNKFDLFNSIPPGPTGAKARFYFWATALARRASGENQFYTALALHEVFDANSNVLAQDELIREQALKAYRSTLDNFFDDATVFSCCPASSPTGDPVQFAQKINLLVADNLVNTDATGLRRLVNGDPILVLELLLQWGYVYDANIPLIEPIVLR